MYICRIRRRPAGPACRAALLTLTGALVLPATAQADVLVSNMGQLQYITAPLGDSLAYGQTFTVGADGGNYTLSSIETTITNGAISSADMGLLTVAIWSTHASGTNAGRPDSPLYTLTKPASIAQHASLERFDAPANSTLEAGKTYAVVIIYTKSIANNFDKPSWRWAATTGEDANPASGWSIGDTGHIRLARSTSWSASSRDVNKALVIRVNGSALGTGVTLSPTFASGTVTYTASVANSVDEVMVTPTTNHASATVKFYDAIDAEIADADTNAADHQVALAMGANTIVVGVTAEDGSTSQDYTVTVTRSAADTPPDLHAEHAATSGASVMHGERIRHWAPSGRRPGEATVSARPTA